MKSVRQLARRGRNASGAIGAQLAQALASLVLSIAAARSLGADGLGIYGLISGGLVLTTAIATGLVGDSLTVLDRAGTKVRSGLQVVGVSTAVLAGVVGGVVCLAAGLLNWQCSLAFGLASVGFILEEFLRRTLMASLRFWCVFAVDMTCLAGTVIWLVGADLLGSVDMLQILLALFLSQVVAFAVAVMLLPEHDRHLAPWRGGDPMSVMRFGSWRAAQQAVRPAMLTAMRIIVVIAAGTVAFGELEAARVYTAPTLLIVNGIGGFLFATYAIDKHKPLSALLRKADFGAVGLFAGVFVAGAIAAMLLPWAGPIVTGNKFAISETAVFGWVIYSATAAVLMPYGSLAAVTGMHVKVFTLRLLESVISLAAVAVVVFLMSASPSWVPYAMSLGTIVLGVIIRQYVLIPQSRQPVSAPEAMATASYSGSDD